MGKRGCWRFRVGRLVVLVAGLAVCLAGSPASAPASRSSAFAELAAPGLGSPWFIYEFGIAVDADVWTVPGPVPGPFGDAPAGIKITDKSHPSLITNWGDCPQLPGSPDTVTCPVYAWAFPFFVLGPLNDKLTFHGTGNAQLIYAFGNGGNDEIRVDQTYSGTTRMIFRGEGGDDVLEGGPAADNLLGGAGGDTLIGHGGIDVAQYAPQSHGLPAHFDNGFVMPWFIPSPEVHQSAVVADNDGASGDDGNAEDGPVGQRDTIATDVETIWGTPGNDTLAGFNGPDVLNGGSGDDVLHGGGGNDLIEGNIGDDQEFGDAGNDTLGGNGTSDNGSVSNIDSGADVFTGGSGSDTVTYATRAASVSASIDGVRNDGNGDDENGQFPGIRDQIVSGAQGVENIIGGSKNDSLAGNDQPNTLEGGSGADTIVGWAGDDVLRGADGNDLLLGLDGHDVMYGDEGKDTLLDEYGIGSGNDILYGGNGEDILSSGAGADTIYARDPFWFGATFYYRDTVDCGASTWFPDKAQYNGPDDPPYADDVNANCEVRLP